MSSSSFALLLRRLPERDSAEVSVRGEDTVAAVCQRAAVAFGRTEAGSARLCCFRGKVLPPTATLSAAGVTAAHFVVVSFAPPAPTLTRVCGGKGWVVHGLVLEFSDGVRTGYFGENDGSPMPLSDDAGMARRGGVWYDVRPGERLVSVTGHDSSMGYLCGSVTLQLSSGRAISVAGENPSVFGGAFTHAVPEQPVGHYVELRFDAGRCTGVNRRGQPPPTAAAPSGVDGTTGEPPRVLNSIAQLLSWRPPAGVAAVAERAASAPRAALPRRPRTLHCHDMAGGYNEKADVQYLSAFSGWPEVDVFVYFAHNRVSMPPRCWVDACHARGVPCLGTLITEADDGENDALLADAEGSVEALCALCEHRRVRKVAGRHGGCVPRRATTGSHECIGRLEAAHHNRQTRPGRLCSSRTPCPFSQPPPKSAISYVCCARPSVQAPRLRRLADQPGGAVARGRRRRGAAARAPRATHHLPQAARRRAGALPAV